MVGGLGMDGFGPGGGSDGGPGGWDGPVFEFNEETGGLQGDFFKATDKFSFDPSGGGMGMGGEMGPEGGPEGDPFGDFFGDYVGPEGDLGPEGDFGPGGGMEQGVKDFFDPNQEGGFDVSQFFVADRSPEMGDDGGLLEMVSGDQGGFGPAEEDGPLQEFGRGAVSYTHLTLPTICSV